MHNCLDVARKALKRSIQKEILNNKHDGAFASKLVQLMSYFKWPQTTALFRDAFPVKMDSSKKKKKLTRCKSKCRLNNLGGCVSFTQCLSWRLSFHLEQAIHPSTSWTELVFLQDKTSVSLECNPSLPPSRFYLCTCLLILLFELKLARVLLSAIRLENLQTSARIVILRSGEAEETVFSFGQV